MKERVNDLLCRKIYSHKCMSNPLKNKKVNLDQIKRRKVVLKLEE